MGQVTNFSITERAAIVLDCQIIMARPLPGHVLTLAYMSTFVNADGTPVEGFWPGYSAAYMGTEYIGNSHLLTRLPNRMDFICSRDSSGMPTHATWSISAKVVTGSFR